MENYLGVRITDNKTDFIPDGKNVIVQQHNILLKDYYGVTEPIYSFYYSNSEGSFAETNCVAIWRFNWKNI